MTLNIISLGSIPGRGNSPYFPTPKPHCPCLAARAGALHPAVHDLLPTLRARVSLLLSPEPQVTRRVSPSLSHLLLVSRRNEASAGSLFSFVESDTELT